MATSRYIGRTRRGSRRRHHRSRDALYLQRDNRGGGAPWQSGVLYCFAVQIPRTPLCSWDGWEENWQSLLWRLVHSTARVCLLHFRIAGIHSDLAQQEQTSVSHSTPKGGGLARKPSAGPGLRGRLTGCPPSRKTVERFRMFTAAFTSAWALCPHWGQVKEWRLRTPTRPHRLHF